MRLIPFWFRRHIVLKLIGGTLLILMCVLVLSSIQMINEERRVLLDHIDVDGELLLVALSNACVEALLINDYSVLETLAESMVQQPTGIIYVQIMRQDGRVVAEAAASTPEGPAAGAFSRTFTSDIKVNPDESDAIGHIVLRISTKHINDLITSHTRASIRDVAVLFVAITILMLIMLKWTVVNPLHRLEKQAHNIGEGDLDTTIDLSNVDELGRLAGALDTMRINLKTSYKQSQKQNEELKRNRNRLKEKVEERTKELRDAQEELVRKEKLAVLGQMAGSVGHELRNPLGVISNAVYFLNTVVSDADETVKEYLEMISSEVGKSKKIISDLLDFGRTKIAVREEIAISELVEQVIIRHAPPEKVEVITRIAAGLPYVFVDSGQISQVLDNIVMNAYQAMPEGGELTIEAKAEKGKLHLSITDTGCGISKESMKKLFEPLFTTKARGIGLGLSVSKLLVEANGGSIEVESEEGKGSTFTLILPAAG